MQTFSRIYWQVIYFLFPLTRDFLLRVGLIWHNPERQPFSLGFLKKGISKDLFQSQLYLLGFRKNIIAWVDNEEVISMRLLDKEKTGFHYHVRLFKDGEIRGHYEKTPEKHPIDHFLERGTEERSDYLRDLIAVKYFERSVLSPFKSSSASIKYKVLSSKQ